MAQNTRTAVIGVAIAALLAMAPATTTAGSGIRAVMDGKPISLEDARQLSCHDFDYPVLTCFETSEEMAAAAAERAQAVKLDAMDGTASVAAAGYVIVYVHGTFGGPSRAISRDYSYLGTIGWNDVISSLMSFGASGRFYEHAPPSGFVYFFYATSQVSYVGNTYNDKFSSVELD